MADFFYIAILKNSAEVNGVTVKKPPEAFKAEYLDKVMDLIKYKLEKAMDNKEEIRETK